ncbi:hypothetical protein AQUCO_05800092v1 [Aquilegia coerulea]|uniref:Methyltransferase small domain-containing protein n=1 Tax=Aquilegia coerulea TaxID=218851 RepID=A0A2G5CEQ2_AQUCA|nr:hypothetical protein AQUCO_05800092v1 [Aquilegia coerulea]
MRAPSLLAQCWPGLLPQERGSHEMSTISERTVQHLPSPAVEISPSKFAQPSKYIGENMDFQGLNIFKGKLSCGYGLPGIFACLKGASTVHFQDLNAELIRCKTIPNVVANLEEARDRQSRQLESPLTPSRHGVAPDVHFYAGDWEELHTVLSVVTKDGFEMTSGMSVSYSEEDLTEICSSQDGSIMGNESSSRRSKKLSGSRAWERAIEADPGEGGYDVILMTEIPYSTTTLKKLHALIKKCLRPPYGVLYLGTKKHHCGGVAKHLKSLIDEEGIFGAHVIMETADREMWKFFLK